jgi:uncharacterized protein YegP (UPF0339 family)
MKIEMLQNRRKQWYMRLVANGRIIMHSESYSSKSACKRAVKALYIHMTDDVAVYIGGSQEVLSY